MSSVQRGVLVGYNGESTGPDDITWCATWQDADEMFLDTVAEFRRTDSPVTLVQKVERDVSGHRPVATVTPGTPSRAAFDLPALHNSAASNCRETGEKSDPTQSCIICSPMGIQQARHISTMTAQAVDAPVEKQWRDMNVAERNAHVDKANERAVERNTHNPFDYICTKRIDGEPYREHGLCPICRQPAVPADPPKPAIAQAMSSIAAGLREKGMLSDTTEPITLTQREPTIEAWEVDEENMTFIAALLDGSVSYRLLGDDTVKPNYVTAYVNGVEHPLHVGYWVVKTTDPARRHPKWEILSVEQKERLYA